MGILKSYKEASVSITHEEPIHNINFLPNSPEGYVYINGALSGDKIFVLSAEELSNPLYGYNRGLTDPYNVKGGTTRKKYGHIPWESGSGYITRSRFNSTDGKSYPTGINLQTTGNYSYGIMVNKYMCWTPSFNIDSSQVILNHYALLKDKAVSTVIKIPSTSNTNHGRFVLTIKDGNDFAKGSNWNNKTGEVLQGEEIEIFHDAPNSVNSDYTNVTAMFINEDEDKLLYYGSINTDMNAKSSKVVIPEELALGTYKLKVYGEQWTDFEDTDYGSSVPFETTIKVVDKKEEKINISYDWLDAGVVGIDLPEAEMIVKGSNYTAKELTLEGYTFDGWYFDKEGKDKFIDGSTLSTNTTLYGRLKKNGIPLIPLEPSKPNDKPNIPLVPLEPSKPITKPNTPLVPFEPSDKKAENKDTVQTGDKTNIILYLGIMISSIIVLGTICYKDRKNKNIK